MSLHFPKRCLESRWRSFCWKSKPLQLRPASCHSSLEIAASFIHYKQWQLSLKKPSRFSPDTTNFFQNWALPSFTPLFFPLYWGWVPAKHPSKMQNYTRTINNSQAQYQPNINIKLCREPLTSLIQVPELTPHQAVFLHLQEEAPAPALPCPTTCSHSTTTSAALTRIESGFLEQF